MMASAIISPQHVHPHIRYSDGLVQVYYAYQTGIKLENVMMETRSLSDSKLPLAELEIEEGIAKKHSQSLKHSGRTKQQPRAGRGGSAAIVRHIENGNKRDSRTGEAIGSKMCQEHPERCNVRCLVAWIMNSVAQNIAIIVVAARNNF